MSYPRFKWSYLNICTFLLLALFWSGSATPISPNLFKDSALLLLSIDRDLDLELCHFCKIIVVVFLVVVVVVVVMFIHLLLLPCLIGLVSPAFQFTANFNSFHISHNNDSWESSADDHFRFWSLHSHRPWFSFSCRRIQRQQWWGLAPVSEIGQTQVWQLRMFVIYEKPYTNPIFNYPRS